MEVIAEADPLLSEVNCQCKATCLIVDDSEFNLIPLRVLLKTNFDIEVHEELSG